MTNPQDFIDMAEAIAQALADAATEIGITTAELRFEGQGVDMVAPGIIVMFSPPAAPDAARGLPQFQSWELTLFVCASAKATVAHAAVEAMTIAQKAHMILRAWRGMLELNAAEPFAFVRALPDNFICAVNYDVPFSLFP
ncbi:MAG: hypothetical protein M5R41_10395 [Bacteroidia bacterium]|nr:hypothetical protein [Bacteroidia bacterium]